MRLLCALGLFLALLHVTSCLRIGAFNIDTFGETKSGIKESKTYKEEYEEAMKTIKKIVRRYDIILIQELRDPDGKVTDKLKALVNEGSPQFRNISSVYLPLDPQSSHKPAKRAKDGKHDSYKERYLFLYKDQTVTVKDSFQYDEGKRGVFDRPPFAVKFSSTQTAVEFVLIPIHTSPLTAAQAAKEGKNSTVEQLNALVDVVEKAKQELKNNNIMVLGDFNAGGTYVKDKNRKYKGDWEDIRLFTNKKDFHWLIKDNVDTAVLGSPKAYDRIVVTTDMNKGVVKDTAEVFNFRIDGNLTLAQALAVSNHFPVEVELKPELLEKPKKRYRESDDLSET